MARSFSATLRFDAQAGFALLVGGYPEIGDNAAHREELLENLRMQQRALRRLDRRQARAQHHIRGEHAAAPQRRAQQMQRLQTRQNPNSSSDFLQQLGQQGT
jgi:hypothetical protein